MEQLEQPRAKRCPKAMPLLKEGQRVTITLRGKKACGFVMVIPTKPTSRYCVAVITPPWDFATLQEFVDTMVANMGKPGGPRVWSYVYRRRDELESMVFGLPVSPETTTIQ